LQARGRSVLAYRSGSRRDALYLVWFYAGSGAALLILVFAIGQAPLAIATCISRQCRSVWQPRPSVREADPPARHERTGAAARRPMDSTALVVALSTMIRRS